MSTSLKGLRALIANDGFACTFQSLGQYRSALLREIDDLIAGAQGMENASSHDDVIRLAREAGFVQLHGQTFPGHAHTLDALERFATLAYIAVAERMKAKAAGIVAEEFIGFADDDKQLRGIYDAIAAAFCVRLEGGQP